MSSATSLPLSGLTAVEQFGSQSSDLGRVAVGFAGLMAAQFGATVVGIEPDAGPARHWPPLLPDGTSALLRFLGEGKRRERRGYAAPANSFLLTDDAAVFADWPTDAKVLVRGAFDIGGERPQSELTIMAASGLLDIVGEPGRPPLALPGHAVAYAAGLAAFDALLASELARTRHGRAVPAEVSCLDVAKWLNWKLGLDSVNGPREAGLARREEWRVHPCRDGYVAAIFLDNDVPQLAALTRSTRLLDPDFSTGPRRREHLEELHAIVASALAGRTRDDVIKEAESLRLPFAPVLSPSEVVADPQMRFREFFAAAGDGGAVRPRVPVMWNGVRLYPAQAPAREASPA